MKIPIKGVLTEKPYISSKSFTNPKYLNSLNFTSYFKIPIYKKNDKILKNLKNYMKTPFK